jgi:dTDP-glucose pyrophosphorylase
MSTGRDLFPVPEGGTLLDVLRALDRGGFGVALIVDAEGRLVGVMTDGDVRRALLASHPIDSRLGPFVNRAFTSVRPDVPRDDILELMRARQIEQVPIVGPDGHPAGLHLLHEIVGAAERPNWAVVMAGGRGTRLGSLTSNIPKPMLRVAGRPILERIVLKLVGHGIRRVFLSINYLGHLVEQHFGDGSRFGCQIEYLREDRPLGTGGSLSLLPVPSAPVVVMNGDLVTQADVGELLDFHEGSRFAATVGVRRYLHTVAFGCVDVEGQRITSFEEKPTLTCMINGGIYVLSPALVRRVPANREYQLPELLVDCLGRNEAIGAFEIHGDWFDVGQKDTLQQARGET